jgi:tripartite ATP-independent transporter DctP family solute receptor
MKGWARAMNRLAAIFSCALAALCCAAPVAAASTVRVSLSASTDHPYNVGAVKFKEVLERESKGEIKVQIFNNSQLGDESASLEAVRTGSLEFAEHLTSLAASAYGEPQVGAWALPFLYPNSESAWKAWDSPAAVRSYAAFDKKGFKCIARWDAGFRELSSSKPVNSLADVKGLRLRTPAGKIYIDTWKALGAAPVPMAITELYTALQTGVVSGTELPLQAILSYKYYEVQKSDAMLNYIDDPICFSVSAKYYDSLSRDLQKAVMDAAAASSGAERQAAATQAGAAVARIKQLGMTVTQPDLTEFRKAVAPVYDDFYKANGPDSRALVQQIQRSM